MFLHAATIGQKECDWVIHHGWREQSPPQSLHDRATAIESINPNFNWVEIQGMYQEVYQLQKLPGESCCEGATEEQLWEEILASIKKCLWLGMPLESKGEHPSSTPPQRDSWAKYLDSICRTHKGLTARKWDQDDEMLALNRDAHWKALPAATLLKDRIKRLGHSTSRQHSQSCWHTKSCQCSASWHPISRGHQGRDSQPVSPWSDSDMEDSCLVASHHRGIDFGRDWSPSPIRQKCQMMFAPGKVSSPEEPPESYAGVTRPTYASHLHGL